MIRCVNENCNKDPFDNELEMVLATPDADFACCAACRDEFNKQREHFLNVIVHDDKKFNDWMNE